MSFDLLDRLISDICQTTQNLIDSDAEDLSILNVAKGNSTEKEHSSQGETAKKEGFGKGGKRPMNGGVHRTVC